MESSLEELVEFLNELSSEFKFDLQNEEHLKYILMYEKYCENLKKYEWDEYSINLFKKEIRNFSNIEVLKETLYKSYCEATSIGTSLYTKMLKAYLNEKDLNVLTIEKQNEVGTLKLNLLLKHIGAKLDCNNFLQISHEDINGMPAMKISHELHAASYFYEVVNSYIKAMLIRKKNGYEPLKSNEIHQLRYYFDRQNIKYIRDNFKYNEYGKKRTDVAMLKEYFLKYNQKFSTNVASAKYHQLGGYKSNKKVLTNNKVGEFIISPTGNFVTQWDYLIEREDGSIESSVDFYRELFNDNREAWCAIVNTESLNYATSYSRIIHGQGVARNKFCCFRKNKKLSVSLHMAADVVMGKYNSDIRRYAKKMCLDLKNEVE